MVKIYCDTGGYPQGLKSYERQGMVEIIMFPYENVNKKIRRKGKPSQARWSDLNNFTWKDMNGSWSDYIGSNKFEKIKKIIGSENYEDILHLDSAYKSGCKVFFTRDRNDIINKRDELEKLLDIKIYHPNNDWEVFEKYIKNRCKC